MNKFNLLVAVLVLVIGGFFIASRIALNEHAIKEGDRITLSYKVEQAKKDKDGKETKEMEIVDSKSPYNHFVGKEDNLKEFDKLVLGQKIGFEFEYAPKDKKNELIKDAKTSGFKIIKVKKCTNSDIKVCFE